MALPVILGSSLFHQEEERETRSQGLQRLCGPGLDTAHTSLLLESHQRRHSSRAAPAWEIWSGYLPTCEKETMSLMSTSSQHVHVDTKGRQAEYAYRAQESVLET